MKITDVTCYPVWGGRPGRRGGRNFLFVVVDTDEGIYGVGEAGLTGRELAVVGAIEHFKPFPDQGRHEQQTQRMSRGCGINHDAIVTALLHESANLKKGHKFVQAGQGEIQ